MSLRLYFDVHIPSAVLEGLRRRGIDVLTSQTDGTRDVSDEALLRTMFFLWERMKIVVEPTGVLAATALLEEIVSAPGQRVGVVISGGNVDLGKYLR